MERRNTPVPQRVRWLLVLTIVCTACALWVAATGGFEWRVAGVRFRMRAWNRPAALAAVGGLLLAFQMRRSIAAVCIAAGVSIQTVAAARVICCCAALSAAVAAAAFSTAAVGGSDSYGYVSQARLLSEGRLTDTLPSKDELSWPDIDATLTPLAYRRGQAPGVIAPTYPPGFPLLLAPLEWAGRGTHLVVPLFGVLLLWLTYRAGHAMGAPLAGALASLLQSLSPTFLYQLLQPMSDVPAAACWMAALVLSWRGTAASAAGAGAAASLAILIRPNLAPLAILVLIATALASRAERWRAVAACTVAFLPALLVLAWIQDVRYGSPWASGYGAIQDGFAAGNVWPNLQRYPRWLTSAHTWFIWFWLATPLWFGRELRPAAAWTAVAFIVAIWGAYLPYGYFGVDEWSYTRFLLPALPFMLLLACVAALALAKRLPHALYAPALAALVVIVGTSSWTFARQHDTFALWKQERRYPAAGAFVRDRLGPAFVLASQHSGSLRYYAGCATVRWDRLDPSALDSVLAQLRAKGITPYAVLDEVEDREFRQRFASQRGAQGLVPLAEFGQARVYGFE